MGNRYRSMSSAVSFVLILLFSSNVVRADVTGSIQGVVRDRTQAAISGAKVTVINAQTNFRQETTSAADGSYRFLALPAGTYQLTATSAGFREFNATDAVQVQTENTQLGDVIDSKKMLALPLNGRSYIDLLGLQAGVAPANSNQTIQQDARFPEA